jgi:hypothetical protein
MEHGTVISVFQDNMNWDKTTGICDWKNTELSWHLYASIKNKGKEIDNGDDTINDSHFAG